jgi:hypothetical protein
MIEIYEFSWKHQRIGGAGVYCSCQAACDEYLLAYRLVATQL